MCVCMYIILFQKKILFRVFFSWLNRGVCVCVYNTVSKENPISGLGRIFLTRCVLYRLVIYTQYTSIAADTHA